jgi:hypothetical protein
MRATYPAHLVLIELITLIIFGEAYRLWNSSLRSLLQPPATSHFATSVLKFLLHFWASVSQPASHTTSTYKFSQQGKVKVKLFLCLTSNHVMKTHGRLEVQLHAFVTSVLNGGEWSASRLGLFTPGIELGTHWTGGWVGLRAGLDVLTKRKHIFPTPDRNRNPVVQSVA